MSPKEDTLYERPNSTGQEAFSLLHPVCLCIWGARMYGSASPDTDLTSPFLVSSLQATGSLARQCIHGFHPEAEDQGSRYSNGESDKAPRAAAVHNEVVAC